MALKVLEDEILGPNGFLRKDEENPDNDGYFVASPGVNFATKVVEQWIKDNGEKSEPGTFVRVKFDKPTEEELSEYR